AAGLDAALTEAVRTTLNRADSDGCMSTNDTVVLMSSGASGTTPDAAEFQEGLRAVCADLARQLIADAEGAAHEISVRVVNATTEQAAEAVARAVARSNLFKTAVFGQDPNWGRVISAVGTVPEDVAPFDPDLLDVTFNGVQVCRRAGVGEDRDLVDLSAREVSVVIDLHAGEAEATILTNDLTHEYVHENSAYSS
ncbi:MAG TPA: bifunctional ornithine acetyltransferase/N-acetylglutamate synthase, partial [Citricoccus sp.]